MITEQRLKQEEILDVCDLISNRRESERLNAGLSFNRILRVLGSGYSPAEIDPPSEEFSTIFYSHYEVEDVDGQKIYFEDDARLGFSIYGPFKEGVIRRK